MMSDPRPEFFVILNPWQAMTSAVLYSVAPSRTTLPIVVWNPELLQSYFKLKNLSEHVSKLTSELDGLLPITPTEFLKQLEMRRDTLNNAASEPMSLISYFHPKKLLVLADTPPSPWFWQNIPKDTEVHLIAWDHQSEHVEQLMNQPIFKEFNATISWIKQPFDLVILIWQALRTDPFPTRTEMVVAGDTPEEILTGIYHAKKESIPLFVARIHGEGKRPWISKAILDLEQDVNAGSEKAEKYEPINRANLCDTPRLNCLLEASSSLDFVAAIIHSFEQEGQVILYQPPSKEVKAEAEYFIKRIDNFIAAEDSKQAQRELQRLSTLVSHHIPHSIQETLAEFPEIPVQIV